MVEWSKASACKALKSLVRIQPCAQKLKHMLNRPYKKRYNKFYPSYQKILSVIESCETRKQLETCQNWVSNINFFKKISKHNGDTFDMVVSERVANHFEDKLLSIIDLKLSRLPNKQKPIGY